MDPENVLIMKAIGDNPLFLEDCGYPLQTVPIASGQLKIQGLSGFPHALLKLALEGIRLSLEKQDYLVNSLLILLLGDLAGADPKTAAQSMVKAGPFSEDQPPAPAMAQREQGFEELQGFAHGVGGRVGTEIKRFVFLKAAHDLQPGEGLPGIDAQCGIVLIVAKNDIVAGPVLLDEACFQKEGFLFAGGDQILDVDGLSQKHAGLDIPRSRVAQVTADPLSQIFGLAHIEHSAIAVLEQINPRQVGHSLHPGGKRRSLLAGRFRLLRRLLRRSGFFHDLGASFFGSE